MTADFTPEERAYYKSMQQHRYNLDDAPDATQPPTEPEDPCPAT